MAKSSSLRLGSYIPRIHAFLMNPPMRIAWTRNCPQSGCGPLPALSIRHLIILIWEAAAGVKTCGATASRGTGA